MIVVSDHLTTGQITFIFRVVIQALSYGGLFIFGLIILSSAPAAAPVDTHDVVNRIVGRSSVTTRTMRWIFTSVRRKNRDSISSCRLLLALLLLLSYGLFVSISDIGFIGFHACEVAGGNFLDFPASVRSDDDAKNLIASNLFKGADPASVRVNRCDATEPHPFSVNITLQNCTSWHNSTYADPNEFRGLNVTDSDVLMPLQLSPNYAGSNSFELNMYYSGPGPQSLSRPVIARGLALVPHDMGLKVVVGVPHLQPHQQVVMPKAMALEVEVGCMALGIKGVRDEREDSSILPPKDVYATGDTWRDYTGPDYLSGVLSETVDIVREGLLPLFNQSDKTADGDLLSYNASSFLRFSWKPMISNYDIPDLEILESYFPTGAGGVMDNCTHKLYEQLGLPTERNNTRGPTACALKKIGGSIIENGTLKVVQSTMVCASTTQLNMVSATVAINAAGNMTVVLTRLPSNLNIVEADYWDVVPSIRNPNTTSLEHHGTIHRYVLSDNATGPVRHFLFQESGVWDIQILDQGVGTGVRDVFQQVGSAPWDIDLQKALMILGEENYLNVNLSTSKVTAWAGEIVGSCIQATLGYNGWAARNNEPLTVTSTGGRRATCFDARYGVAFMPLFVAALVIIVWGTVLVLTGMIAHIQHMKIAYGGLTPYTSSVGLNLKSQEGVVLVRQSDPHIHFEVVPKDTPED